MQNEGIEAAPLAPLATLDRMHYAVTCDVLLCVPSSSPGALGGLEGV